MDHPTNSPRHGLACERLLTGPGQDVGGSGKGPAAAGPEFAFVRPALYQSAWETMILGAEFESDENGDIAAAFVQVEWLSR